MAQKLFLHLLTSVKCWILWLWASTVLTHISASEWQRAPISQCRRRPTHCLVHTKCNFQDIHPAVQVSSWSSMLMNNLQFNYNIAFVYSYHLFFHTFGILMSSMWINLILYHVLKQSLKKTKIQFVQNRRGKCQQSCDNGYAMWVYPVGTEVNPTIISNRANLLLLIVIPLFPAKVPVKELARGERPHIALQITCTSPPLSMHNFQPETADENGHLTTDFWLLAPQKDSFPLLTAFSSGTAGAFKPPAHERPSAAANT